MTGLDPRSDPNQFVRDSTGTIYERGERGDRGADRVKTKMWDPSCEKLALGKDSVWDMTLNDIARLVSGVFTSEWTLVPGFVLLCFLALVVAVLWTGTRYTPTLDVCVFCSVYVLWVTLCLPWLVVNMDGKFLMTLVGAVLRLFAADIAVMAWSHYRGHSDVLQRGLRLKPVMEPSMSWLTDAGYNLRFGVVFAACLASLFSLVLNSMRYNCEPLAAEERSPSRIPVSLTPVGRNLSISPARRSLAKESLRLPHEMSHDLLGDRSEVNEGRNSLDRELEESCRFKGIRNCRAQEAKNDAPQVGHGGKLRHPTTPRLTPDTGMQEGHRKERSWTAPREGGEGGRGAEGTTGTDVNTSRYIERLEKLGIIRRQKAESPTPRRPDTAGKNLK